MTENPEIDLYANLEDEFTAQDNNYDDDQTVDLYEDVIAPTSEHGVLVHVPDGDSSKQRKQSHGISVQGAESFASRSRSGSNSDSMPTLPGGVSVPQRRFGLCIGNLNWWTTDEQVEKAVRLCGVTDLLEVKFYENRLNGQSKGFCIIQLATMNSYQLLMEKLKRVQIDENQAGPTLVMPCNRNSLAYLDARSPVQERTNTSSGGQQAFANSNLNVNANPGRVNVQGDLRSSMNVQQADMANVQRFPNANFHQQNAPFGGNPRASGLVGQPMLGLQMAPSNVMRGAGPQFVGPPGSMHMSGGQNLHANVALPTMSHLQQPNANLQLQMQLQLQQQQQQMRGVAHNPMLFRVPGPAQQSAAGNMFFRPGMPLQSSQQMSGFGSLHPGLQNPANLALQTQPTSLALPQIAMSNASHQPVAHVNPAFLQQMSMSNQSGGPPQNPMESFQRTGPPLADVRPPLSGPQHDRPPQMGANESEIDEILLRNKQISSSAIHRAVEDASAGDFTNAIETLVTAISLIKQSRFAADDRCKILIGSLQDTLHSIESKSYQTKSSTKRERDHEKDRDRDRDRRRRHDDPGNLEASEDASRRRRRSRSRSRSPVPGRDRSRSRSRERDRYRSERDRSNAGVLTVGVVYSNSQPSSGRRH